MASCLVRSFLDRAVRVRALAGDIVLCSWARHLTLTVPLSTQEYKWVPVKCWGKPNKFLGSDLRWTSIPSRGSRMLLAASCYGNRNKVRPDEPVGSKGFTHIIVEWSNKGKKKDAVRGIWTKKKELRPKIDNYLISHHVMRLVRKQLWYVQLIVSITPLNVAWRRSTSRSICGALLVTGPPTLIAITKLREKTLHFFWVFS